MKKLLFILTCLSLIIQLTSCSSMNHSNFSKKKYTNFKTAKARNYKSGVDSNKSSVASMPEGDPTIENVSQPIFGEKKLEVIPTESLSGISNEEDSEDSETVPNVEMNEGLENVHFETDNEVEGVEEKEDFGNRTDFERLTKEQQVQRLIQFNALFNATAVVMIFAG